MKSFWTLIFIFFTFSIFSQQQKSNLEWIPNQFILQLEEGTDADIFFNKIKKELGESGITFYKPHHFSKLLNLYLLESVDDIENVNVLLHAFGKHDEVKVAGQSFKINPREKTPDDPLYTSQWDMEIINAPAVWESTTGGVTALGDTIVVAMMESGDWRHDDLIDNVWINRNEINNDGIDNDGNGFVDDYFGWNSVDSSDVIGSENMGHGSLVGGIIGAKGDNNLGISGVNWNVKIMWTHNDLSVPKILECYEYVYENRKLYNETNGEKGAFVVATNGSFGISGDSPQFPDGLQLEDNPLFPLWCEMHQRLGEEGILGVGATSNKDFDVEEFGDMPSICPTDYLIVVGENNQQDELASAYGNINVDLTAPGQNSPSTYPGNLFDNIDGTSAATPHVAGGIALLYSLPCEKLAQAAKENPAEFALVMKGFILNGVDEISDQADKTVSGGRLNLEKSMELIQKFCGSGLDVLTINILSPNPTAETLDVNFTPNQYGKYKIEVSNSVGQLMFQTEYTAEEFLPATFRIDNLGHYQSGVYFLTISNELDFVTKKFVIY